MGENIRLSLKGIFSHKMRSFLTMLGIIIGIASIIAIVSTIQGTNKQIEKNLIGAGDNLVKVSLYQDGYTYYMDNGLPQGIPVIDESTKQQLEEIEHCEGVSVYRQRESYNMVFHLNTSMSGGYIRGIESDYLQTAGLMVRSGRGISDDDNRLFRQVALVDDATAQTLFDGENPVGKTIEIQSIPFTVVGTVSAKEEFEPNIETMDDYYTYHQDNGGAVYIPTEVWPLIYQYDEPQNVILKADTTANMTSVGKQASEIVNMYVTNESVRYQAQDLMEQAKQIQQLSQSTNTMLIWIAAISLLVGGIGVMNIMLVTVTERTKEIGLKKAIGARKKTIMMQFLTEAVVLTSLGGILGVITGVILSKLISLLNGTPTSISIPASIFSVLFSMLIGIVFGLIPSFKAADLDPIEALRHE